MVSSTPELLGGGLCAILHGDEERVGGGLHDERDADGVVPSAASVDPLEAPMRIR
jgi:hypothetical protein